VQCPLLLAATPLAIDQRLLSTFIVAFGWSLAPDIVIT
jgi:hypothetical protein